jgi:lactoylglutathione lyase
MNMHMRLLVDDYEGCFRFYRDVMGLDVTFGDETSGYADFALGATSFSLFLRSEMEQSVGALQGVTAEAERDRVVLVFGVTDLDACVRQLQSRGARIAVPMTEHPEWGIRTAHLRDPDGNLIELNVPFAGEAMSAAPAVEAHGVQGDAG